MLIALGNIEMNSIIDGMISMAKDQNVVHEHNQITGQGQWTHGDGWGIAYLRDNQWILDKSPKAIYDDPKIDRFRNLKTNLVILHARKKSVGKEININNCHPFQNNDFLFCHNGTIKEKIFHSSSFKPIGATDSERLFYSILSKLPGIEMTPSIKNTLNQYQSAKGTNIILSDKQKSYIYIKENIFPLYYEMKIGKKKDLLLISSEKLKNINLNWETLESAKVYTIDNKNLNIHCD